MILKYEGTEQQRKNLLRLASYLDKLPEQSPFDMQHYLADNGEEDFADSRGRLKDYEKEINECGHAACGMGHAPLALRRKPLVLKYSDSFELDYIAMSGDWFGVPYHSNFDSVWNFLFSAIWVSHDNTPEGLAKRIRLLVEGRVPKSWDYRGYEQGWAN